MRAENLHEVIRAAPFRPFDLCLADGSRAHVPHPEWIAHPPGARTAVVMGPDESVRIIDIALVLEIRLGPLVPPGPIAPEPDGREGQP